MRAIDADALKKVLSEPLYRSTIKDFGEILKYTFVMDIINEAPTIGNATVAIQIVNEDGASLDGYLDKSRQLIFTKYGIVGVEVLKAYSLRKYTIIEDTEGES